MYHSVAPVGGNPVRELVPPLSTAIFERQLLHVRSTYRVVPPSEIVASVARRRRGEPFPVAITFDDDLRSHIDVAAPVLRRLGLPAAFFLTGAALERPHSFWWERLQRAFDRGVDLRAVLPDLVQTGGPPSIHRVAAKIQALSPEARTAVSDRLLEAGGPDPAIAGLRADAAKRLAENGFEIGFHTLRHDPLPGLDDATLRRALTAGRRELEEAVEKRVELIAYPHGSADARVARAAAEAGFRLGFGGGWGALTGVTHPLLVPRVAADDSRTGAFGPRIVR